MPTHALGDTAVFGRAYLWGESSTRCNAVGEAGPEIVWFVDRAEVAQHLAFGLVIALSLACLASGRRLGLVALSFSGLLGLALRRAIDVDGPPVGVALPFFWLVAGWALVLCSVSIERLARESREPRVE